jgi:Brp/Blh family beta-carotene 15,15'-monooxygenase
MIDKINFRHSIFFLILSIFITSFDYFRNSPFLFVCLVLVASIGISHGALDNVKGAQLLKIFDMKSMLIFYVGYSAISVLVICVWLLSSTFLLFLFLLVASYHFGKEDSEFLFQSKKFYLDILFFLKGLVIISAPLLFQYTDTINIFNTIGMNTDLFIFRDYSFIISCFFISIISSIAIVLIAKNLHASILIIDLFAIIILNYFLHPLFAFTLYFCFLHSVRHSITLMQDLDKSIKIFIRKSLPLTIVTASIFVLAFVFLMNEYDINSSINKVIFVGLAALTFPHIILEYILEKNGK